MTTTEEPTLTEQLESSEATSTTEPTTRPQTGDEYLESLRDGREVWFGGERVEDVTTHPAFRNSTRMVARLYDALHDDTRNQKLVVPTDTGNGGVTHPFYKAPHTIADLQAGADGVAEWARLTYGWMGRSPDYKAAFISTLGSATEYYSPFQDNARRWYKEGQEKVLYFNHAIVNPPVDRNRAMEDVRDVYMHVEKEVDGGLIVSGAKVVATGSVLCQYNFIGNYAPTPIRTKEFSAMFAVPMATPGVKLICRPSYEYNATSPFDNPLSSRLDENDSIFIFDNVFVPWENVFCYDPDKATQFYHGSGFIYRGLLQSCVRLAVKFDFLCGVLLKCLEMTGTRDFRGVQTRVGELITYRHLFWSLATAMVDGAQVWTDGTYVPDVNAVGAFRVLAPTIYPKVREIFEKDVASALIYTNSNAKDWDVPELRQYLDRYVRGSNGYSAEERVKVLKLAWDAIGSEFGSRHELYELNYAGNHEQVRIDVLLGATQSGLADDFTGFVDQCMSEYDTRGWTVPDLVNPHSETRGA
jgi:4-hydroxyphenylacetate 3-monooxygenase